MIDEIGKLTEVLKVGGGYAVAAVFIVIYLMERKDRLQLQKTVIRLAVAAEKARSATASAIHGFKSLLEAMRREQR